VLRNATQKKILKRKCSEAIKMIHREPVGDRLSDLKKK
jgi:hypothetical protein